MRDETIGGIAAIVFIVILFVGLPVLILLLRDRVRWLAQPLNVLIFGFAFFIVVAVGVWIAFNLVWPTTEFWGKWKSPPFVLTPILLFLIVRFWWKRGQRGIEELIFDPEAPEFVRAKEKAQQSLGYFINQVDQSIDGAFVRIFTIGDDDAPEDTWGYVHTHDDGCFSVSVAVDFRDDEDGFIFRQKVPESEVIDWQIIRADGLIKGAYSIIAAFEQFEARGKRLNRTMKKQKAMLLDAERPDNPR